MSEDLAETVTTWYAGAARDLPWRRPGTSPWAVLVSEVMLQQTPVARVEPVWEQWVARWPSPAALAADPAGEAVRAWGRLGYPRRALRLHAAATAVVDRHGGRAAHDRAGAAGPARGRRLHRAGGRGVRPAPAARRSSTPTSGGWSPGGRGRGRRPVTRRDLALVLDLLPADDEAAATASVAFMELGALVCTARAPRCPRCPLLDRCAWVLAGRPLLDTPVRRAAGLRRHRPPGPRPAAGRPARQPRPGAGRVLAQVWDEPVQRARALDGLVVDGLVDPLPDGRYALPA